MRATALSLALVGLLVACGGEEDIELGQEGGVAGAVNDGSVADGVADAIALADGGFPEAPTADVVGKDTSPMATDAAACDAGAAGQACRALGDPCGTSSDCCSGHCASNVCSIPGPCAGAGMACSTRADCCSGLCEPVFGTASRACLAGCRPVGAACARASDCCSFACNAGMCGGSECLREGSDCSNDADCCSGRCDPSSGNKCILDPVAVCRPTAEDCTSGGGNPCCGICDDTLRRCDPGSGACRPIGMLCVQAADCCHGAPCVNDGTGRTVCSSPLLADGLGCLAGFECASGSCTGNPPSCGAAPPACGITGSPCSAGAQCCSGSCSAGTCQLACGSR